MVPHDSSGAVRARPAGLRATLPAVTARSEAPASFRSSSVRPSAFSLVQGGIREVLSRRRLIAYLVRADLKKKGSDTLLGNVWWFLDPLLQMMVYSFFVGIILDRKHRGLRAVRAVRDPALEVVRLDGQGRRHGITSRERLIKQIYFPKLVLPVSAMIAGVVSFAFGLVPLVGDHGAVLPHHLSLWPILLPIVMLVQLVFSMSVAIMISAANVFYRDVGNLVRHVLRMWFYLSPALYPAEHRQGASTKNNPILGDVFAINPWTVLFGGLPRAAVRRHGAALVGPGHPDAGRRSA